ncbi:hypothetical protein M427DRAFT_65349 [Gonapodya prolifera JEL478]|uniref:Amidohydrolase 3 domain-containing protein n=1 Tax=Gonapodya prolifera (strain JEL478) TaxID=1344416 RepID=A0A139B0N5_GONPJ|nr:hypothetical protein M427DRAFT_65349 [Gonapodya prolifera JEL478]|eukprot:KXS22363.1 hypothetical protein M427DRAFT_65349 [Gonapodya prolifera JEL478]
MSCCTPSSPSERWQVSCCCSDLNALKFPDDWPPTAPLRLRGGAPSSDRPGNPQDIVTVLHNARVVTVSQSTSTPQRASAIAVRRDGTIAAVGDDEHVLALAGEGAKRVDLDGKAVLPGFIDPHTHPTALIEDPLQIVDMFACPTKSDVLATIRKAHESESDPLKPIGFQGFNHSMQSPDASFVTRKELDAISLKRPIIIVHNTWHSVILNSAYFALVGVDDTTPDFPNGGLLEKDSEGRLNGRCHESCVDLFVSHLQRPSPSVLAGLLHQVLKEKFARKGITTVGDVGAGGDAHNVIELYRSVWNGQGLPVRVLFHPNILQRRSPTEFVELAVSQGAVQASPGEPYWYPLTLPNDGGDPTREDFAGHLFALGGIKFLSDASGQGRTAYVTEHYSDEETNYGFLNFTPNEIEDNMHRIKNAGLSPVVHAIGDHAIDLVVKSMHDVWGLAKDPYGADRPDRWADKGRWRLRVDHVTVSREDQYPKMKEIGALPSFMSSFFYWIGDFCYDKVFGPKLKERMCTWGTAKRFGIPFNVHSDAPVVPPQPIKDIQLLTDRKTDSGRSYNAETETVAVNDAIKAVTYNSALALGAEKLVGSIEVGKYADFVVLSGDPTQCDISKGEIGKLNIVETWIAGERRIW